MIKVKKDRVRFKGSIAEICAEVTILCMNLRKSFSEELPEEIVKELIIKAVNLGLKTEEEINKEISEKLANLCGEEGENNE